MSCVTGIRCAESPDGAHTWRGAGELRGCIYCGCRHGPEDAAPPIRRVDEPRVSSSYRSTSSLPVLAWQLEETHHPETDQRSLQLPLSARGYFVLGALSALLSASIAVGRWNAGSSTADAAIVASALVAGSLFLGGAHIHVHDRDRPDVDV
jgi:hypothetical protein